MKIQIPLLSLRLLLLLLANEWTVLVVGQVKTEGNPGLEDLESMSDDDLERICVERGFELIRDDSQGALTHADFVEAAQRCLAIEEDM